MNRLLFILSFLIMSSSYSHAQHFPFQAKWKQLEENIQDGKLKSNADLIDEIYNAARQENKSEHLIKALIFKSQMAITTSDDEDIALEVKNDFLTEIEQANAVEKSILQSMLASLYFYYYNENSYKIINRSTLNTSDSKDFRTWDTARFTKEIDELLQNSLHPKKLLEETNLTPFEILIEGEEKWRYLRPMVFDILAHRALNIYQSEMFKQQTFDQYKKEKRIESIYEELIHTHQNQADKNALIDINLQALKYKYQDLTTSLPYKQALENLYQQYQEHPWATNIAYELAYYYSSLGEEESDYVKAMKICENAVEKFPKSLGAEKCKFLMENIQAPHLTLDTDPTLLADQYNPLYITHKNMDALFYHVYQLSLEDMAEFGEGFPYEYRAKHLKIDKKPIHSGEITLKKFTDYKTHSTKIPFEPLAVGNYILVFSSEKDINSKNSEILLQTAIVSTKIDMVSRMNQKSANKQILLADKTTGVPLANTSVELFESYENGPYKKVKTYTTDGWGTIEFEESNTDYYRKKYLIILKNGHAYLPIQLSNYYRRDLNIDEPKAQSATFTDRAIYRPGQTVYFKTILFTAKDQYKEVKKQQNVKVTLYDTNNEKVSDLDLISNDFGSVQGDFILPSSGNTGSYYIRNNYTNDYKTIQVEEYKRPKFKAEIKPFKDVYSLNDTIQVNGMATTFSGVHVTDAKVAYRVYREAYNPYDWWRPYQTSSEVEISQGNTITNNKGEFSFTFESIPSKPKQKGSNRAYVYKIVADVTDISGETHTAEQSVHVGDIPFQIRLDIDSDFDAKNKDSIQIITTNLNGEKTALKGKLEITEIKPLNRILREKQQIVEYELLDKQAWVDKLPYIAYNNDMLISNKERGRTLANIFWDTTASQSVTINQSLPPGMYEIKATAVYQQDTISAVEIYHQKGRQKKNQNDIYLSTELNQKSYKPGDVAKITFDSDVADAHVLVELEANGKIVDKILLDLQKNNVFTFPIHENYRGNVFVHYHFTKYNQTVLESKFIKVPYDNKKLEITTSTLRNKLKPGDEETWQITIKGHQGDKVLAEMLAGMYDKSLDEFSKNPWKFFPYDNNYPIIGHWLQAYQSYFRNYYNQERKHEFPHIIFEDFNLYGLRLSDYRRNQYLRLRGMASSDEVSAESMEMMDANMAPNEKVSSSMPNVPEVQYSKIENVESSIDDVENIVPRKRLEETAFFYPNLKTDADGNVKIEFTTPESLTTWNFQTVAHTQDMQIGYFQKDIITQKELMVVPNAPRFLREGDEITFKTKIINLSEKKLQGKAKLMLFDAFSMKPIENLFKIGETESDFVVDSEGNTTVSWTLKVPNVEDVQSVLYRIVARSSNYSDGEENALPILSNRTLVTETLPMSIRENQSKEFKFDKLLNATSETLSHYQISMEMTTNPIWYAIMALPYLREYPYECSEQIFAKFYGNVISQHIVNGNPKIKAVFDDWNKKNQLISPLEKNEELKNILLTETPWAREAQSESEQMKRIAVLFDLNKMRSELKETYQKLEQKQSASGGFPWFQGGIENRYITTHIVAGLGHLNNMDMNMSDNVMVETQPMLSKAIEFIDNKMLDDWKLYQKDSKKFPMHNFDGLYWLYARSYHLKSSPMTKELIPVRDYFIQKFEKDKFKQHIHQQAMLSLIFQRYGEKQSASDLISTIKDRAVTSDEMGMYWKENVSGYRWNEAPVETQALLIEAFDEITPNDTDSIESMKVWLLKNKQTNQWNTTKATTEAVYALMNTGKDWANASQDITIKIGDDVWYSNEIKPSNSIQSGSGYVKESWDAQEIKSDMGTVAIRKKSPGVAWGAMYWQYFEDLDKITSANTNIKFKKELYIQRNTAQGPKLFKITEDEPIKVGDLVKVRLEIQSDRAMEFVHIKDMRASGFEPVDVISQYKWQDGLGYYQSTRDAATNFFIDYMPKGVYVFEYDLRANNVGKFSNGITQLQNMYAPEFSAHSKGLEVTIQ